MPAIYFSLGNVQPFADMKAERPEEGVTIVTGDGRIVGLRLDDPRKVLDLPEVGMVLHLVDNAIRVIHYADAEILLNDGILNRMRIPIEFYRRES